MPKRTFSLPFLLYIKGTSFFLKIFLMICKIFSFISSPLKILILLKNKKNEQTKTGQKAQTVDSHIKVILPCGYCHFRQLYN